MELWPARGHQTLPHRNRDFKQHCGEGKLSQFIWRPCVFILAAWILQWLCFLSHQPLVYQSFHLHTDLPHIFPILLMFSYVSPNKCWLLASKELNGTSLLCGLCYMLLSLITLILFCKYPFCLVMWFMSAPSPGCELQGSKEYTPNTYNSV